MEEAGAGILHIDVMDGHFVPNLTIGVPVLEAIRRTTELMLDVHLMISNADQMADAFVKAGADSLLVHYEAVTHLDRLLEYIRENGARAGVALNPHTPVAFLEEILPKCDTVLIMAVNPGFGGQKFIPASLGKVRKLKSLIQEQKLDIKIEIDGGVEAGNIAELVEAGADILVSGSAIFGSSNPGGTFRDMQRRAQQSRLKSETNV